MVGQYKNKNQGIYKILNTVNDHIYIGSTIQGFSKRWCDHRTLLYRNKHKNPYLQNAWNKYGKEAFVFIEQERLNDISDVNKIREREQYWIDNLKPEYNLSDVALYGAMSEYGLYTMIQSKGNKYHLISPEGIHYCSMDLKDFAKHHNLNAGSLRDLCSGKLHILKKWRGSAIKEDGSTPYLHTTKKRTRNYYHLVSPKGVHMCTENIKEFCKENDLSYAHMVNVCNPKNKRRHHKQWNGSIITKDYKIPTQYNKEEDIKIIKNNQSKSKTKYIYTLVSPDNKTYTIDKELGLFAKQHNLRLNKISECCKNNINKYKGWVITRQPKSA